MKTGGRLLYFWLGILFIALEGCNEPLPGDTATQEVFFEMSYTNFAWLKQHQGFLIDKDGRIGTYDSPEKADSREQISIQHMKTIQQSLHWLPQPVGKEELRRYASKIKEIKQYELSPGIGMGNDQGSYRYYAFLYDEKLEVYTQVLLAEAGDVQRSNPDSAAIAITAWLKQLQQQVYQ